MLYDIEIWYHVIFCCRLQNAILNRIMLIHIMAKKCTIIQYCSRLCCNINHLNMSINCTPIHHTMIWYNVISHYIYLQCAVLWLQCIPLCHMHLKLSKLHSNTLEKNCTMYCHTTRPVFGKRLDQNEPSMNSITINLTLIIFNNPSVNKWTINMNNQHESMIFSVKGTSPGGSVHAWSCRGHTANLISLWIQNHYVTQKRSQYTTWYNFTTPFCVSTTVLTIHCDMRNGPNKPNAKLHISFFGLALALPYLFSSRFSASKVSGLWMSMVLLCSCCSTTQKKKK